MRAGEPTALFSFEKREPLPGDAYGVSEGSWIEQFRHEVKIVPFRRGEAVIAARLSGVQPYILTIRSFEASRKIETDWRAKDIRTGITYNIRTKEPSPDRASIDMIIEAGVVDG